MPIPTSATAPPPPEPRNSPTLDTQRPEYVLAENNQAINIRYQPQLIPRPAMKNVPSGYYNVFLRNATPNNEEAIPPITNQEVLNWARYTVFSLVDNRKDGTNVETAANSNIRAKNNIFAPSGLTYPNANGGALTENIMNININTPQYQYYRPVANDLSNAGTNYYV